MAEDYSIELALLLALVREPDIINHNQITWGKPPAQKSYDIVPPITGTWMYGKGREEFMRDTTFHELFRWFSNPAYRKRYGLDK